MDQAIADIEFFIEMTGKSLKLTESKLVVVGSGYFGSVAGLTRNKHDTLVVGAWASSAPVLPHSDFFQYDH